MDIPKINLSSGFSFASKFQLTKLIEDLSKNLIEKSFKMPNQKLDRTIVLEAGEIDGVPYELDLKNQFSTDGQSIASYKLSFSMKLDEKFKNLDLEDFYFYARNPKQELPNKAKLVLKERGSNLFLETVVDLNLYPDARYRFYIKSVSDHEDQGGSGPGLPPEPRGPGGLKRDLHLALSDLAL